MRKGARLVRRTFVQCWICQPDASFELHAVLKLARTTAMGQARATLIMRTRKRTSQSHKLAPGRDMTASTLWYPFCPFLCLFSIDQASAFRSLRAYIVYYYCTYIGILPAYILYVRTTGGPPGIKLAMYMKIQRQGLVRAVQKDQD